MDEATAAAKDDYGAGQNYIHEITARQTAITELQKHIGVYIRTKEIYAELATEKKSLLAGQKAKKSHMLEVMTAQNNVKRLLNYRSYENY